MSLKKDSKKSKGSSLGDLSGIKWKDLDHKKVYGVIAALLAVIVLLIVLIVNIVSAVNDDKKEENPDSANQTLEDVTTQTEENSLEVNAHEEINALVERYFEGLSSGDTAMVESTVDVLTDEEKHTIEKKKDYIEAYNEINCYTKKGLEENSYVVFASYEMKIYNIETPAPGIMALYVCTAEDGSLYIYNSEASEELTNYVLELASEEDVAAIISDVDSRYQQLTAEDEDLGKFAEKMLQSQEEAEAKEPETPVDETTDETTEETADLEEPISTTVTDNVRIRAERSTDSSIVTTIAAGTGVKVYANYEDGWSKVEYDGSQGYCKTEFLASTEGAPSAENTEETSSETASGESVNKQMQLKDTVKIRADRSTDSERIATGYAKELVTVLENYGDGWSKIEYNGKTGYCKTEFLREPQ